MHKRIAHSTPKPNQNQSKPNQKRKQVYWNLYRTKMVNKHVYEERMSERKRETIGANFSTEKKKHHRTKARTKYAK